MHLDAIVFDFDGLIIDTEVVHYKTVDDVFRAHGTAMDYARWQTFIGRIDHPHWTVILEEQLGRPIDRDAVQAERQVRYQALVEALPVLDGIGELIDEATRAEVPMAVASSSSSDWVRGHLDRLGLVDRFVAVCTGDEVAAGKPAPDVYLLAIERLGVAAGRAVAVEDSPNGCLAARAAGMHVVAVPSSMTRGLRFEAADLLVESAAEIDLAAVDRLVAHWGAPRTAP